VKLNELVSRVSAFNFMLPIHKEPIFHNNVEAISQEVARTVGELFKYLIFEKKEERTVAQRFLLQCVLAMFSEDFGFLPDGFFTELVRDCQRGESSYDLLGGLFRQMASQVPAKAGRFKNIPYFNGGLLEIIEPLELDSYSLDLLYKAACYNWKSVNPSIFGALFEGTLSASERHAFGAHFTNEVDILKIVNPTIIRPWKQKIEKAQTLTELVQLREELSKFKVLDPACGCGNFLFIAYRTLKDLEMQIVEKIAENFTARSTEHLQLGLSKVSTKQMFGIDIQPIAVEVAKMTLMLAKEIAADEWNKKISSMLSTLGLSYDSGLPLDTLDENVMCKDALLEDWPSFDVVIGNPPFQSKNKMKRELDPIYINKVRERFLDVSGRADFCVYWFRKAHELMKEGQRAGLVGTNTIRQNYSREGGLDYI
ncbi:MAG: N-6 DNA methylase, partial [Leptospiraceae bacterium]|nr:N-6 DNA methylase [Leptospiraceae bacterium]